MDWKTKKLGDICSIKTGKKDVNQGNPKGVYPFFTCAREHTFSDSFSFDVEALLIAGNGDVGTVSYYKGKFEAYQRTYVLFDFKNINIRYLYIFLDGFLKDTVSKQKLGNTMPYIKLGMLTEFEIPLPPLSEQKRIVKILDEVFAGVGRAKEIAQKNARNAREVFEAYLGEVFESGKVKGESEKWEEKRLNEVSENLDNKRIPITKNVRSSGSYPYYGASGIVDYVGEYIFDENLLLVSEDGANLLARTYPIAFSVSGKSWVNNHAHVLKFEEIESQKFVEYYLNSIKIDPYVSGMAQPKLNQKMLNSIPIPYPNISLQKAIVKKLDALSAETKKLEGMYARKLADLEELKKSVLKSAFAGKY